MENEDKMTIDERRKYLRLTQKRYLKAGRAEKGRLLDEAEVITGMHRKALIRLLNSDPSAGSGQALGRNLRRKQRGRTYGVEVHRALMVIAESCDWVCAERLQPNLVWLAEHLTKHNELEATPELLEQLGQISVSTVQRVLQRLRQDEPRLPRKVLAQAGTKDPQKQIGPPEKFRSSALPGMKKSRGTLR